MAEISYDPRQWNANGVDPKLLDVLRTAAGAQGLNVQFVSGSRPGDTRQHGKGNAIDVKLVDPKTGRALPNYQNAATFRTYEQFAQAARQVQQQKYPEIADKFRWGGYFSGPPGRYGANDEMHFDLAGDKIGMAGGSWDKGLTPAQSRLFPGAKSVGMNAHPLPPMNIPQTASAYADTSPPIPAALPPALRAANGLARSAPPLPTSNIPAPQVAPIPAMLPPGLRKPDFLGGIQNGIADQFSGSPLGHIAHAVNPAWGNRATPAPAGDTGFGGLIGLLGSLDQPQPLQPPQQARALAPPPINTTRSSDWWLNATGQGGGSGGGSPASSLASRG